MPTKAEQLADLRSELISAEDCALHRPVSEIRDEITAVRHASDIPAPRKPT